MVPGTWQVLTQLILAIAVIIIIIIKVYLNVYMNSSFNMFFEFLVTNKPLFYSIPATLFHSYTLDPIIPRTSPPPRS